MENTYIKFLNFLKSPSWDIPDNDSFSLKLRSFLMLFVLELLLTIILLLIYKALHEANILPSNVQKVLFFKYSHSGWKVLLLYVIIAPVAEEIIFRLNLRVNEKYLLFNIFILIIGSVLILINIYNATWFRILILASGIALFILFIIIKARITPAFLNFWRSRFGLIFYLTAAIFGLLHISNYNLDKTGYIIPVILVLPQFVMGLFFGFTRLFLGFGWGCTFHALHNFTFLAPAFIAGIITGTGNYSFGIKECNSEKFLNYHRVTPDTVEFDHLRIDDILSILLIEDKRNFEFEDPSIADKILILSFNRAPVTDRQGQMNSRAIVIDEILKRYSLKLKQKYVTRKIYELRIIDSVRLNNYKKVVPDSIKSAGHSLTSKIKIGIHSGDLSLVARILSENLDRKVIYRMSNKRRYEIIIPKSGIEDINKVLTDTYGLQLINNHSRSRIYKISSAKRRKEK